MGIIDISKLKTNEFEAIGKVRIDLTDPLTGKVKERIEGKNHVFNDMITSGEFYSNGAYYPVLSQSNGISTAMMVLNDDGATIDPKLALVRGQTIGYGVPGAGSSGAFKGSANMANQILAEIIGTEKARWKFQYEFLPSQANGIIKNVGLTQQYTSKVFMQKYGINKTEAFNSGAPSYLNDARFAYTISSAGVVTKYDKILKTQITIDLSAIVGAVSTEYKSVGYAPRTGKYYVWRYSSTTGNRKMYVFTDNTFSNLESTLSSSNITIGSDGAARPFFVYGDFMYYTHANNFLRKANFVANTNYVDINFGTTPSNCFSNPTTITNVTGGSIATNEGIYFCDFTASYRNVLFSPDTDKIVAYFYGGGTSSIQTPMLHPLTEANIICGFSNAGNYGFGLCNIGHAYTTYLLPSPVTKTSANGMTATYELEVIF